MDFKTKRVKLRNHSERKRVPNNTFPLRLGILFCVSILTLLPACTTTIPVDIDYKPTDTVNPILTSRKTKVVLYLPPVEDQRPNKDVKNLHVGIIGALYEAIPDTSPSDLFHKALATELQRLGIQITNDKNQAQGYLQGILRIFQVKSTVQWASPKIGEAKIDLELYQMERAEPIGKATLQGSGQGLHHSAAYGREDALNEALANAISSLNQDAEFRTIVAGLAVPSSQYREGQELAEKPSVEPTPSDVDFGNFYALIIGNNDYQYLPKLQTARNDAIEMGKTLRERFGFETEVLLDATRNDILNSLNDFRSRLGSNDSFLIYYAGHGEFDSTAAKAYWLPVDAKPDSDANWIIVDSITANIKRLSSKHILIVADSCYSGTMTRSALTRLASKEERDRYLKKMFQKPSRTLLASGGNEPVAEILGSRHSVFAGVFLKALNSDDQMVFTAEELFYSYIKESVAGGAEQTPEYSIIRNSGHDGGDFLFVRKK